MPLSLRPLLFESTRPMLSSDQCNVLKVWIKEKLSSSGQSQLTSEIIQEGIQNKDEGALILSCVQKTLHRWLGERPQDPFVVPRFLSYTHHDTKMTHESILSKQFTVDDLLPDGLHVDANNSKHFRHWTVLLYLDTCEKLGATNFPLAIPFGKTTMVELNDEQTTARKLIMEEDMYHTRRVDATEQQLELGKILDRAALDLVRRQFGICDYDQPEEGMISSMGIRVMPRHGHVCVFSGLTHDGYPDPLSFHGGEALFQGESKELLSFFYEVPLETFCSRDEFGARVKEREERFVELHGFQRFLQ